jgi:hypothetical protein
MKSFTSPPRLVYVMAGLPGSESSSFKKILSSMLRRKRKLQRKL